MDDSDNPVEDSVHAGAGDVQKTSLHRRPSIHASRRGTSAEQAKIWLVSNLKNAGVNGSALLDVPKGFVATSTQKRGAGLTSRLTIIEGLLAPEHNRLV
jgi:hypothetical protein